MAKKATIYGYRDNGATIASQKDAVLDYLKKGGTLTQNKAFSYWSVTRLPAIIHLLRRQLREEGGFFRIVTNKVTADNKFGATCRFAEYKLISANNE